MFAVIETGGKQYKVQEGLILDIERLPVEAKEDVTFDKVLLIYDGKETKIGNPYIEGATVAANTIAQHRDDKKLVFKMTKKTGYKRTRGHRQYLTTIKIKSISAA